MLEFQSSASARLNNTPGRGIKLNHYSIST